MSNARNADAQQNGESVPTPHNSNAGGPSSAAINGAIAAEGMIHAIQAGV